MRGTCSLDSMRAELCGALPALTVSISRLQVELAAARDVADETAAAHKAFEDRLRDADAALKVHAARSHDIDQWKLFADCQHPKRRFPWRDLA